MEESKTLVIATLGPVSHSREVLKELIKHHMNIARLNFSWGSHEEYKKYIKDVREIAAELGEKVLIMGDLSGPRVQTGQEHHFGGGSEIITEKDRKDLAFGLEQGVDYIAMSFVGNDKDIVELRELIKEQGGNQKIIAKIERRDGVTNIDKIIKVTDGIMVARGDLGNEFPLEEIPFVQHEIIRKTKNAGKMVIVATQMLESMVAHKTPTRAEVSDVAYAILDGADGVMLSEESASGKYPIDAVIYMEKIAKVAEKKREDNIIIG